MARDGWTNVASLLRADEAELLRELLESAGVEVLVEDAGIMALNPLLQSAVGGAKVFVREPDAARARAVIAESGVFAGEAGEAAEIPEEEWSAGASVPAPTAGSGRGEPAAAPPDPGARAAGHAFRASFAALALAATLVVPLYALVASVRALRATGETAAARRRGRWALAVSLVALALGLALWGTVLPGLRLQEETEQRERLPPQPRGHPARP